MTNEGPANLEEILDELLTEEATPSHGALTRWCARYPEFRAELMRFFATWAEQEAQQDDTAVDEASIANRLVSHALELAYERNTTQSAAAETTVAPRLLDAIRARGMDEEQFAVKCGLDDSITAKLDRRLIRQPSIPRVCLKRIAAVLALALETVSRMLAGDPIPLYRYKAEGRPEVKTEDFVEAVRSSDLPDEAKREWERIVAENATEDAR